MNRKTLADAGETLGFALVCAGLWMAWAPLGVIAAGVFLALKAYDVSVTRRER